MKRIPENPRTANRILPAALWAAALLRTVCPGPGYAQTAFGSMPPAPGTPVSALATQASSASYYSTSATLRWDTMILSARISLDLRAAGVRMPSGRSEAENMIERDLPGLLQETVFRIPVDSYRTVGDTLADGTLSINDLLDLIRSVSRRESSFSPDFRRFSALYELPLTDIASLYVRHSRPYELAAPLDYAPSRPYSGIVIYAKGELPVRGEHVRARAMPCLFPRVFDDRMNTILERNLVSPEAIRRWGLVGYTEDLQTASLEERTGDNPLRIAASGVFGTSRTDLVISREDALKILTIPANRTLLQEGRVVVVIDKNLP